MLGTIARLAMLRFLPRRLVPLLAAWQVVQLVRANRRRATDRRVGTDEEARRTRPR